MVFLISTARQAAIRSLTDTAFINSFTSRILVIVWDISDISRIWLGRCFALMKYASLASM